MIYFLSLYVSVFVCFSIIFSFEFPELSGFLIDSWKELVWLVFLFYLASAVVRFLFVLMIMFLFLFLSFRWYKIQSFLSFKLFPNHIISFCMVLDESKRILLFVFFYSGVFIVLCMHYASPQSVGILE